MELQGRTVLLTGAAGGIGTAIAQLLAKKGMKLVLSGRREAPLEELRASLFGDGHVVVTADLGVRAETLGLIPKVEAAAGPVDLLVNNAGIEVSAEFHKLSVADLDNIMEINIMAPMLLTHAVIPGMLERGRGHVVQMSSIAGLAGGACGEPYAASKGGLVKFTESLRATYLNTPLTFSTVCPGFSTGGGMYSRMLDAGHSSNAFLGNTTVDDVAAAVVRGTEKNVPLILCNNRPVRPLAGLTTLTPRVAEKILERSGANQIFRDLAADREAGVEI